MSNPGETDDGYCRCPAKIVSHRHLGPEPRDELEREIQRLRRPGMLARDLAPLLPAHLRAVYWGRKVDEYLDGLERGFE